MEDLIFYAIFGIILIIAYTIMRKKTKGKEKNDQKDDGKIQSFINLKDIKDNILITLNNLFIGYINIEPISIDLLNNNDKERFINNLKAELVNVNYEFDIFSLSQPFNIDKLKEQYENDITNADGETQRKILKNGLKILVNFAEKGNVVERKFYLKIVHPGNIQECEEKLQDMDRRLKNAGLKCHILNQKEIIKLVNLFNNYDTYNYDNYDKTDGITNLEPLKIKKENENEN